MRQSSHYPRDGGDIPVPKAKKVFTIYDAPNAEWMEAMVKKCLKFFYEETITWFNLLGSIPENGCSSH